MGLNGLHEQIAHELSGNDSEVQQMTAQLREEIINKAPCDAVQ
jgi:hypothetical protein